LPSVYSLQKTLVLQKPGFRHRRRAALAGAELSSRKENLVTQTGIFGPHHPLIRLVETELVGHVAEGTAVLTGPADIPKEVTRLIGMKDREYCAVVHLNARYQAISVEVVSVGTLSSSLVHPREVFKAAILANAQAIICAHNHPSGEVDPSDDDLALQRRLVSSGDLIGIPLLDFVIVSGTKIWSSQAAGNLPVRTA
jgi:DNA repair protein RadC